MTKLDEKGERGLDAIGGMMGQEFADKVRRSATSGAFGAGLTRMAIDYAFADAWGREGLPRREKSLVVIGALIALKQTAELKNHVKIGVANGLTVQDLENVLIQAVPYVGMPRVSTAVTAVIEALREIGIDPNVQTSEEQGLL